MKEKDSQKLKQLKENKNNCSQNKVSEANFVKVEELKLTHDDFLEIVELFEIFLEFKKKRHIQQTQEINSEK